MVEETLDFPARQPDTPCPRRCSIPILAFSHTPGLDVLSSNGMAEPLRVPPYVPAVPSSGESRWAEPRNGMAEPLRVPPYVPAPSSGDPCRVEPRSGFHRSVPPVVSTGEAMTRAGRRSDLPLTGGRIPGTAGAPALRLERVLRSTSAPRQLRNPPAPVMLVRYPG